MKPGDKTGLHSFVIILIPRSPALAHTELLVSGKLVWAPLEKTGLGKRIEGVASDGDAVEEKSPAVEESYHGGEETSHAVEESFHGFLIFRTEVLLILLAKMLWMPW